jgi:hypothetical protein
VSARAPSDEELVAFAESLLEKVEPDLRARHVLEEAIRQHRTTWLTLYEAASALRGLRVASRTP